MAITTRPKEQREVEQRERRKSRKETFASGAGKERPREQADEV